MSFAFPWALIFLPLPLLVLRLLPPRDEADGSLSLPPALAEAFLPVKFSAARRHLRLAALTLSWIALVLALTGPRQERVLDVMPASGRDIVLALDLSGSMEREDFALKGRTVSRLEAVQAVAGAFVRGRSGDRIGVVVFGDRPYVAAALTHDVAAVAQTIDTLRIGISGKATAIADGLGLAMRRLRDREATSRVVVLLSDGQDTSGVVDPVAAAEAARRLGIKVYTIALGPTDLSDNPDARDAVDTRTLQRIAEAAGAQSFRVTSTSDLQQVTEVIDRLEPSLADMPPVRAWQSYWPWLAALSVASLGLTLAVRARETA
ncbi:VWA domain-containing protein [Litorisediminicola beolgyonensis]|uniref:VWA domain-containing protein n=1 Tax=Litorisediminicola beolgyonensis TaxID=1173614 RepID=A0ABW3ZGY2_9RHOB